MGTIRIITDSNTCLPEDICEKYRITIIPFLVTFGDEIFRDGIDISSEQFYRRLPDADPLPTTSSPTPTEFQAVFEDVAQAGASGIVVVSLSSKLSMMYEAATLAAEGMKNFPITVVDSGLATMAEGFVALAAAQAAEEGLDFEGVEDVAQQSITRSGFAFVLDTLLYLHKGGRVPAIAPVLGSALKLYPVIGDKGDGTVGILAPAHGKRSAIERSIKVIEDRAAGRKLKFLAVMHGNSKKEAEELKEQVMQRLEFEELYVAEISPVMGAHAGPGTIGLAYQIANS